MDSRRGRERGIALVVVLLGMLLLSALAAALVLTSTAETHIAMNFHGAQAALYAADAAAERALDDLGAVADWTTLLDGTASSPFIDGPPGTRVLDDGSTLDLGQVVNIANCQKLTACALTDINASTDDRPWGANNPRWSLFGYGRLSNMLPAGAIESRYYVVTMVGDDPGENDNDPTRDSDPNNPGSGIFSVRAEAFGPAGAHKVVELTVARGDTAVRTLSWRELR